MCLAVHPQSVYDTRSRNVVNSAQNRSGVRAGAVIAVVTVLVGTVAIIFWPQVTHGASWLYHFLLDHRPPGAGQRKAFTIWLWIVGIGGFVFHFLGHRKAYGIAVTLTPLLWIGFWKGLIPWRVKPTWGPITLHHLTPPSWGVILLWALALMLLMSIAFWTFETFQMTWRAIRGVRRRGLY
jgi:hypothetical protein